MDEDLPPPVKSDVEKAVDLTKGITSALESALGQTLDRDQLEEVRMLVTEVTSAAGPGVGTSLKSLTDVTGLKPSQIGPVVELMSNFHPKDSEQANFVKDGVQQFRTSQASKAFDETITTSLSQPMTIEQTEAAKKFFNDLVSVNQDNAGNLDKSFEALQKATGLEKSAIAKLALDVTNTVYPGDNGKKDLVNDGMSKQLQTSEVEPAVAKEKTDLEKSIELAEKLTKGLETALGKKLDQNMLDEVDNLATGVVLADRQGTSIDDRLQDVLRETGLKSYQIGPVVDMISKYHEKSSEKAAFVGEGVGKFQKIQEKDNSAYLDKVSKLTLDFNTSLEKAMGKPMTEAQKDASAKLVMNYTEANKGQLGPAIEELTKVTGLTPGKVLDSVNSNLFSFHQDNPVKQALVVDGLVPFYGAMEKQQDAIEQAGRKFDETIEQALDKPMTPEQRQAADKFFGDLVSVSPENVGNLDKSFEELQKATGMDKAAIAQLAMDVTNAVYPGDQGKKDLVNEGIGKQLQTSEVEVELAHDSFILPSKSGQEKSLATGGQSKDDIIEAIRKEVIEKQNAFLIDKIAERSDLPLQQQQAFKNGLKDPDKAREYLESDKGKGQVEALMKDKRVQKELAKIESTGYSKVHGQFKESYRDVAWKQETGSKTRVSEVTNADGEKVASIKETTHDTAPTKVTLSDGTEKTIRSYREIEFPPTVDKGPAHFSMALKDENGRNVPEKDAVYFTAHYDDSGKLMEVSSPKPVKFAGTGPDAIGYIERDGQVLTLPVTREKYNEMMQEVAINNGRSTTVDRGVEQAVDSVAVGSKESPVKVKEQVEELAVTGRPRSGNVLESDRPVKAQESSPPKTEYSPMPPPPKSEYGQLPPKKKTGTEYTEFPVDNPQGAKKTNPLTGQVVDPQVAKKAEKLKEGLVDPKPKTPAPKEQGRPRSQSMPPPKPKEMVR